MLAIIIRVSVAHQKFDSGALEDVGGWRAGWGWWSEGGVGWLDGGGGGGSCRPCTKTNLAGEKKNLYLSSTRYEKSR